MAYLSEENANTYRALLSGGRFGADVEPSEPTPGQGPKGGSYGFPTIPSTGPLPATGPSSGPIRTNPVINQPIKTTPFVPKSITGKTTTEESVMIGKDTFTPKSFQQGAAAMTIAPTKTNFMPLVYIGGAGLLLYFLLKK